MEALIVKKDGPDQRGHRSCCVSQITCRDDDGGDDGVGCALETENAIAAMAAKTRAKFRMSIYSWFVSSVPKKMAKASTHVKQIFMNGRSGRDCCGAVTTSARRPNTKPGLIWRSAAAQRRARGASHPAQKRSERIGRRFEIANPPVPRRRLLLSSGTVTR